MLKNLILNNVNKIFRNPLILNSQIIYRLYDFFSKSLPKSVLFIGCVGFLINISTTMIYSQMAMFLKNELGTSAFQTGLMDGIVEFFSHTTRIFSGLLSDHLGHRKMILSIGCFIILFVKPLFIFANSTLLVFLAQSFDRFGNGLQASPREALVCDMTSSAQRGQAYGFLRSLRTVGSFLGSFIAIWLMILTSNSYKSVFYWACLPIILAILLLLFKVQENKPLHQKKSYHLAKEHFYLLDRNFWNIIILAGTFELAHFSEALLSWRASHYLPTEWVGLTLILMNVGQFLAAYPIGILADRFEKGFFLKSCFLIMIVSNLCLMFATSPLLIFIGVFLWGAQMSTAQSLFLALISEKVDERLRGTAFGIFYFVVGMGYMGASAFSGFIWDALGHTFSFLYSIFFCFLSFLIYPLLLSTTSQRKKYASGYI